MRLVFIQRPTSFDGEEDGYKELGEWLGDQNVALKFMALSDHFDVANLMIPRSMLGEALDEETNQKFLGAGLISIKSPHND